jgi:ADP-heptose:LPS heptosyltransferase
VSGRRPLLFALRALGLGDFVVAVPAFRALRRAFPQHEFRLATTAGVAPLAALVGGIDSLAPARGPDDFATPRRGVDTGVDIAVNLHGHGPQSTDALRALHPSRLLAFRGPRNGEPDWPPWDDDFPGHERVRWCALLEAFGISADETDARLRRPDAEPAVRDAVVVHPGAAYRARRWPPDRFGAVAGALAREGHDVVITGSRAERGLALAVAKLAGLSPAAVLAGTSDVLGLASLISHARLVICGDTGPAHLAGALATPAVVLFGPVPPSRWGPVPAGPQVCLWPAVTRLEPGNPWGDVPDPALLAVSSSEVIDAARSLLAG